MINVSSKFKRLLYSGEGNLIVDATITLADETVLEVSNPQIMSGGLEIDDAVGSDGDFDCIGSTIVNGCDLILYNNNEIYSDYDFINAKVNIAVKLQTDTVIIDGVETPVYETVQKGVYTVDDATFSSISVTLKLLDNMCQFDRPYDSYDIYIGNTTIYSIVMDACEKCGVMPASSLTDMPNGDFIVADKPKDETTYREVIGWCAAIAGCFARCNPDGELEFAWFDVGEFASDEGIDGGIFDAGTPYYTSGDNVSGGTFNPWNDLSNIDDGEFTNISRVHYISALTAQNIGIDDVVITDVQIAYETGTNNRIETKYYPATIDDDNYVISISSIPFIDSTNVQSFYNFLNSRLVGLTFRTCNITHAIHDPTIEAGDIAWLWDTKGVKHRILITRVTFPVSGAQTIVCGAKTPARNSATQMTALAKANARSNRRLNEEISIRAQLEANFNSYIANSTGLYLHQVTDTSGAVTIYGHDKPYLVESKKVLKISNGVIAMTDDYSGDDATTTWYGFEFNGTWLANIIEAVDLFFDHAKGGTLTLGGAGNINGILEVYNDRDVKVGVWDTSRFFVKTQLKKDEDDYRYGIMSFRQLNYDDSRNAPLITCLQNFYITQGSTDRDDTTWPVSFPINILNKKYSIFGIQYISDEYGDPSSEAHLEPVVESDYRGAFIVPHVLGGAFIARSHGIGKHSDVATDESRTQPLFMGIHTSFDNSETLLFRTQIVAKALEIDLFKESLVNEEEFYGGIRCGVSESGVPYIRVYGGNYTSGTHCMFYGNNSYLSHNGTKLAYESSSSIRYKHDIKPIEDKCLDPHKLLDLPVVQFQWNADHPLQYKDMEGKTIPGIIAEDVEKVYPSAVIHDVETGEVESWDERRIIPGMLALIQEQDKKIQELENKLAKLEQIILKLT